MDKIKKEKLIWTLTIGLLVIFLIVSIVQLVFIFSIKRKQLQLEKDIADNRAYIEEKQKEIEYLQSPEYLEDWANENGYVKGAEE